MIASEVEGGPKILAFGSPAFVGNRGAARNFRRNLSSCAGLGFGIIGIGQSTPRTVLKLWE